MDATLPQATRPRQEMKVETPCDRCGRWLHPRQITTCVDCHDNLCQTCATASGHRLVHESALDWEVEIMPRGWTYFRCQDTPYSIHEEAASAD